MAFYSNQDEDQLDPNQPAPQIGPQAGLIGQGAGATSGNAAQASTQSSTPDNPGNFVGIKQYLDANKPQAAKLGDQTAGVITNSADQARQSIGGLNTAAQDQIKPTQSLGESILGKIKTTPEALSDQERKQVKDTESAKYTGPTDVYGLGDAYSNAQKATKTANDNINQSGTEEGRMNLISQVNSKPRTQGMNTFDNALLQSGGGREKLAQAAKSAGDVQSQFDQTTGNIQNQIGRADDPKTPNVNEATGAIGQTAASQGEAYKTVQDALANWKAGFQPKVQQAQDDLVGLNQRVASDLGDNPYQLNDETRDLFGLANNQRVYGVSLNDYLTQGSPSDVSAANVATPEDYARYGALADLAGDQSMYLNPDNASQAGKLPGPKVDTAKLLADIQGAGDKYNNDYANTRTGVLDPSFAGSNVTSLAGFIPGQLTTRRDVDTATPQELEQFWLPMFNQAASQWGGNYGKAADAIQKSLAKWRTSEGYDNVVNPKSKSLNTASPAVGK